MKWRLRPLEPTWPNHTEVYVGGPLNAHRIRIFGTPLSITGYLRVDALSSDKRIVFRYLGDSEDAIAA